MIKNINFNNNHEARQLQFKRSHFILLMCIGLIAILAFTMMNNPFASAGTTKGNILVNTPDYPMEQRNLSEINYCSECHNWPDHPWILVTVENETETHITYNVTGQTDTYPGREGWGVFDELQNEKADGFDSGSFTLPKNNRTYRVFWVDSENNNPDEGWGGSNYTDIKTPEGNDTAPSPPDISGPTSGKTETFYSYSFVSIDDEGDDIAYYIDWDDGDITEWPDWNPSGVPYTESHSWSEPGDYTIKAKARDPFGLESDYETWTVNITVDPQVPELKIRLKMISLGKVRVTIKNKGSGDLSDIKYNITVKGGLLRLIKRIDEKKNGTIDSLAEGEKTIVNTPDKGIKFRLCMAKVTVNVTVGETTFTHNQFVIVIGRFVLARPILLLRP